MTAGPSTIGPAPQDRRPRAVLWPTKVDELRRLAAATPAVRTGWLA